MTRAVNGNSRPLSTVAFLLGPLLLSCAVLFLTGAALWAQPADILPVTKGVYRMPFAAGTEVSIWQDHVTHSPAQNRIDLSPTDDSVNHQVLAAAGGWIEYLEDDNDINCPNAGGTCTGYSGPSSSCCPLGAACRPSCRNNFVWLRHPNGEWTKYTHLQFQSVPAGLTVGGWVNAGAVLGLEGDVGFATGTPAVHLHFEVAVPETIDTSLPPSDPNYDPLSLVGTAGSLPDVPGDDGTGANRQNRIPVFCQAGFLSQGEVFDVQACDGLCGPDSFSMTGIYPDNQIFYQQATTAVSNSSAVTVQGGAGMSVRAGERITLSPGFTASSGSFFAASIGACDTAW